MLLAHFNSMWMDRLLQTHDKSLSGSYKGVVYNARIVIPDYKNLVSDYYKDIINGDINTYCARAQVNPVYKHYGTEVIFEKPVEFNVHGDDQVLDPGLKQLLAKAGPVLIKNAYLSESYREVQQRNRFPHLNFHIDRHISMPTRFSVYTRDPFDEEQKYPRKSSTLFIASIVGYLQAVKEGLIDPDECRGINRSFEIFRQADLGALIGKLLIEQRWDEPQGTGELSMLDNATELHSSYERQYAVKGYRIGVRYLA